MTPQSDRDQVLRQVAELIIRNRITYAEINAIWGEIVKKIREEDDAKYN